MIEKVDRFKLEYAETGDLRRHYSVIRSALSTFGTTVALASFASFSTQENAPTYLIFTGYFMLIVSLLACLAFSLRTERANLYMETLWIWFSNNDCQSDDTPTSFYHYKPNYCKLLSGMVRDEMNWVMLLSVICVIVFFNILK